MRIFLKMINFTINILYEVITLKLRIFHNYLFCLKTLIEGGSYKKLLNL